MDISSESNSESNNESNNESINDRLLLCGLHYIEKRAKNIPSELHDPAVLIYTNLLLFVCYYIPPLYIIFKYVSDEDDDFHEFFQEDNYSIAYDMLVSFIQNIIYNISIVFDIPNIIIGCISLFVFGDNAVQIILVFILQKLQQSYDNNITSVQNKDDMNYIDDSIVDINEKITKLRRMIDSLIEYNIELEERIDVLEMNN